MRLYLVQHAEAVDELANAERTLSAKGRTDAEVVAAFLKRAGVKVARVIHSGKKRAIDTALIFAEAVGPGRIVEEAASGMAPNDPTELVAAALPNLGDDVMMIGHMPFIGRLVGRLLAGDERSEFAAFQPGVVACLERVGAGAWTLQWMVGPKLLGR